MVNDVTLSPSCVWWQKKKTIKRMQAANREALTSEDGNNIRAAMEQASEWLQPNDKTMQACRTWLAKLSEDSKQASARSSS